jgi:large subunit ribosomal protein L34e
MVQRVTYRRRHSYNTVSNKFKFVKTPGGKLNVQYIKKRGSVPKCGDCDLKIQGIKKQRGLTLKWAKQRERHVSRAYGGSQCHICVRERIMRAFLVEEQKIVKDVMKHRAAAEKKAVNATAAKKQKKAAAAAAKAVKPTTVATSAPKEKKTKKSNKAAQQ